MLLNILKVTGTLSVILLISCGVYYKIRRKNSVVLFVLLLIVIASDFYSMSKIDAILMNSYLTHEKGVLVRKSPIYDDGYIIKMIGRETTMYGPTSILEMMFEER